MICTIYLPKREGTYVNDILLNNAIKEYARYTKYTNSIIASPGYFSTYQSSVDDFLSNFSKLVNDNHNLNRKTVLGYFNGVNGNERVNNSVVSNETKRQCYYRLMSKYRFIPLYINKNVKLDHRKILCFFTCKKNFEEKGEGFSIDSIDCMNVNVNAIFIGSSNQSKDTYFRKYAKKGEADILMFNVNANNKNINSIRDIEGFNFELFRNSVVSFSCFGDGHSDTQKFLNNILYEMLESNS